MVADEVRVVGDLEGGVGVGGIVADAGEVGVVVEGQEVIGGADHAVGAGAALEHALGVGAQGVGDGGVGAVDHRGVQPGGHVVGLLARVGGAGAGLGIELGALKV